MSSENRIAYLVSQYPLISHSFIRREVAALRSAGLDVRTYTVRATPPGDLLHDGDRREAAVTEAVLPASSGRLLRCHVWAVVCSPRRWVAALARSVSRRPAGIRALVWSLFYFAESMVLARMLHDRRITHLHNHFANGGSDVGLLAAEFLDIPWSLTLHGTCDFEFPASETLGRKVRAARFVACVSHFGRAQAMRTVPAIDWNRLRVVRCGLDLAEFPFRARAASAGRPFRLLCVCRMSEEKGLAGLLLALAQLRRTGIDAELCLVGGGPDRETVLRLADQLGVGKQCRLPGPLTGADLRAELDAADLFVLSSLMEGLPVVLMEAMASGVPVIAPRLSGIPELVDHGSTGLLFDPGDWSDLAEQVRRLHGDSQLRARLALSARDRVEAQHEIQNVCRPLVDLFRSGGHAGSQPRENEGTPATCVESPVR